MPINGVIHAKAVLSHEDSRRQLFSIFNGEFHGFKALHLKWFEFTSDGRVGGHFHHYEEIFCVLSGGGRYELVSVDDTDRRETFEMERLEVLLVPRRVAHRAVVREGSVIIAANNALYVPGGDFPFSFEK